MKAKLLLGAILAGVLAAGYAFTVDSAPANAAGPKNLKIYPKNTDKKTIKKDMKVIAKALGVECDYCHDMDAMDKDTEHKEKARKMMRMTNTINGKLKKDGFKAKVNCKTCHQGNKKPKK